MHLGCCYQNYRRITQIIIHCSATRCNRHYSMEDIRSWHKARGFADIGYHFYITRDGVIHPGRELYQVGAHAYGFNEHSIGVCYEGGLDADGAYADTRTPAQKSALLTLLSRLHEDYPDAEILGHYQLSDDVGKACPCFDAKKEYGLGASPYYG